MGRLLASRRSLWLNHGKEGDVRLAEMIRQRLADATLANKIPQEVHHCLGGIRLVSIHFLHFEADPTGHVIVHVKLVDWLPKEQLLDNPATATRAIRLALQHVAVEKFLGVMASERACSIVLSDLQRGHLVN